MSEANGDVPNAEKSQPKSQHKWNNTAPSERRKRPSVRVDLNAADSTELQKVSGIGPVLSKRIVKYRKLIGGFTDKSQLKKVYGLSPENYDRIAGQVYVDTTGPAFLELSAFEAPPRPPDSKDYNRPSFEEALEEEVKEEVVQEMEPLDLNRADSASLVEVKGIGPATARNIIKYRKLIYFFHSLDQLSEVWGVRPENLERMLPALKVEGGFENYPHIEVNTANVEELAKHKYLGFKEARLIVAYREQHGSYSSTADLQNIHSVDASLWKRLEPYLRF